MRHILWSFALVLGALTEPAWAQDPGQDPAAEAAARLEEEPQAVVVPVFVLGTVMVKEHAVSIQVKTARETNGAGLKDLIGTSLKVTGQKIQRLEQMAGKEIELRGSVTNGSEFEVLSYSERRTVTAAESAQSQGARGPVGAPRGAINDKGSAGLPSATGVRTPIGALNDPKGAGPNRPNTGVIGALGGRKKPMEPDLGPDLNAPAVAAAAASVR